MSLDLCQNNFLLDQCLDLKMIFEDLCARTEKSKHSISNC